MNSIANRVAEITAALPPEKQAEVLDFVEFLKARSRPENVATPARRLGTLAGQFTVPEDFDAPCPPRSNGTSRARMTALSEGPGEPPVARHAHLAVVPRES